jgi:hypothetical protein
MRNGGISEKGGCLPATRILVDNRMIIFVSLRLTLFYSSCKVLAGSVFAIRRIGRAVATSVIIARVSITVAGVGVS